MTTVFSWFNPNNRENFKNGFAANDALLKDSLWLCYNAALKLAIKVSLPDKRNEA